MSQIDQRLIARYGTLSLLGRGGMGEVYRAFDASRGCEVAIKSLRVRDSALLLRLRREAAVLQRLQHAHVCPIHEYCEEPDATWIVMPVLDGLTLDRCARDLDVDSIVELLIQACHGVEAAHALGLVHRDLKPANLMVVTGADGARSAVVMDFGIAHVEDATTLTGTHEVLGTPAYMAPEQARGETASADARADVWGLGATLYDALTGQPPFGHGSLAQVMGRVLDDDVVSPRVHRPTLPEALARICLKALERDPARRYVSVAELRLDLQRYLAGARVAAPSPGPGFYLRRMLTRHPRFWTALGVLTLAVMLALGVAVWSALSASSRAAAARELAGTVERVRAGMRAARLAPLHPIEQERRPLLADIAALQQRHADAGATARTELDRALAQAWFELGRFDEALQHAQAVLDTSPERADRLLYAHAHLALFAQAWPNVVDLPETQRELAVAALRRQHVEPALAATAMLPQRPPLLRAEIDLIEQRFDSAAATLALHSGSDSGDPRPQLLAGDLARARGQSAQDSGDPDTARAHFQQARKHYREAVAIVRSDPVSLARGCALGARLLALNASQGQLGGALPDLPDADCVALETADPESASTRETLAAAHLALAAAWRSANQPAAEQQQVQRAIAAAERALALDANRAEARLLLARALKLDASLTPDDYRLRRQRLDAAIEHLQEAQRRAPGALSIAVALGEALRDRGRLLHNYRQILPDPESPSLRDDYLAAESVLQQAVAVQSEAAAPRRALALTLMFHFYALRDDDPAQARKLVQAAVATLDVVLLTHPQDPDLLFDQAANLGDWWTFESGYAEPERQSVLLPILDRAFELFARLRRAAPGRADGYDYEVGFRAQAGERLRNAGLPRRDLLQPLPALLAAAAAHDIALSEHFLGWALTERALALAETADGGTEAAFDDALVVLERGLDGIHRHYESVRIFLLWATAKAQRMAARDPQRRALLARAEALFAEVTAGERGRGDNILWCEGARVAWEGRHHGNPEAARSTAIERLERCREVGPMYFRGWQAYYDRLRAGG